MADSNMESAFLAVAGLMQQGRLPEAEAQCRALLQSAPEEPRLWANLGLIAMVCGKLDEAEQAFQKVVDLAPHDGQAWNNLSAALFQQGKLTEAADCARMAISNGNQTAAPWINLGNIAVRQDDWAAARAAYREALAIDESNAMAWCNMAAAEQALGRLDVAQSAFERSLELAPDSIATLVHYGWLLIQRGQPQRAIEILSSILTDDPAVAPAWVAVGHAYKELNNLGQAEAAYRKAIELSPKQLDARHGLATILLLAWRLSEAEEVILRALADAPSFAQSWITLGGIQQAQGQSDLASDSFRRGIELAPGAERHSTLLVCLQYAADAEPRSLLAEHKTWDAAYARSLFPAQPPARRQGAPDRLRLGFVSADFGKHPTGFLALRGIEELHRAGAPIVCYSDRLLEDHYTERFRAASTDFRRCAGMSDDELAAQVRRDEIDVLFDMTAHTGKRMLVFARKPAAVQVTWLGYVGTTGLAAMDYLLADRFHVRQGEEPAYVEQILRMPHSYVCFGPPADSPEVGSVPAQISGQVTFGSFNNPTKLSTPMIGAWSEILRRVPTARLLLKYGGLDQPQLQDALRARFAHCGIAAERVLFAGWSQHDELLAAYGQVDMGLDTQPYSGGLTTCESLWMGVPVVTFPGKTFAGRHATSHLCNAGYEAFVAENLDAYVSLAVQWAGRIDELAQLRREMRDQVRRSPLCDAPRFAEDFLAVVRAAWAVKNP